MNRPVAAPFRCRPRAVRTRAAADALAAAIVIGLSVPAHAQGLSENAVKAGLVFNIGKFVEWPPPLMEPRERFTICHAGSQDAFLRELARLDGKLLQGKPIEVTRVTSAPDLKACAILVFPETEARNPRAEVLQAAAAHAVLTVGDSAGFVASGGAVGLVSNGDRVIFEVSIEHARHAGLRVPPQLARLGKTIPPTR